MYGTKLMTGVELIAAERRHQIEDKGYDLEWLKSHPEYYGSNQLVNAAMLVLSHGNGEYVPENWPEEDIIKLCDKTGIEALKVAGALIAEEIDRLQSI